MSVELASTHEISSVELRKVFCDTLLELAREDPRICLLDADLMNAAGTKPFRAAYPERTFDCGVQEANMIGVAAGLSATGFVPFAHTFSVFAARRACDQIFLSCLYAKQNVKIVGSDPGITAALNGGTHMPFEDIGILRTMPEITIVEPADAVAVAALTRLAAAMNGCWYIRLTRKGAPSVYCANTTFQIGKANLLLDGSDATIIAMGYCVAQALRAAELLQQEGLHVRVLDMFCVKPLDRDAVLQAAIQTGAIVTAENHNILNGLGSAVADVLCEQDHPVALERVGIPDCFGEVGQTDALAQRFHLTAEDIAQKVRKAIARKKSRLS